MNLVKENKAIVPLQIEKEFETLFTKNFSSEPQWSKERRNECFKYFLQTGIPNRKNEEYKYTDTRKLFSDKITTSPNESYKLTSTLTPLNKNAIQIIFVNGMLHAPIGKHTLPKGVIIGSLAEHPDIRKKYLNRSTDTFVNLNAALWTDGALVFIPENVQLEQNIEIINIIKDSKEVLISPRHLIVAEKNSAVNIIERNLVEQSNNSIVNSVTDAILEENSKLRFYKVQYDCKNVALISATHVIQSKNSFFDTNTITLDSEWVRNNLTIELNGTNCESHLNGLYITDGNNHIDNHTSVLHNEPNCQSNQLYKGVLDGKSTGIFNGK
ncbi:MAG TPA: SufD family Fe-S cluster assembly protein, partial [Bacteroidia bacterium]|nr:SufD family Fe-S cluster assembly protein [Bacteroidia bacterium]